GGLEYVLEHALKEKRYHRAESSVLYAHVGADILECVTTTNFYIIKKEKGLVFFRTDGDEIKYIIYFYRNFNKSGQKEANLKFMVTVKT
ncbi:hypothetical protein ACJX0J_023824, partial [Zea mays]